jgi:diguanylate cyclase (GGDEF)-like protein
MIHRLLLVAGAKQRPSLLSLLDRDRWEPAEADSLQQARFMLQAQHFDAGVIGGSLAGPGWGDGLAWLAGHLSSPLLVVGEMEMESVVAALGQGAIWLPEEPVLRHPPLMNAVLDQAIRLGNERQRAGAEHVRLRACQGHVDRLLALLWKATPVEGQGRWGTQRYLLERLDEEVARSQRYGAPLSVVLGELNTQTGERLGPEQAQLVAGWLADRIGKEMRRCDVAGQYGLHGFILLLPQASEQQARGACARLGALLNHPPHPDLPALHACFGLASVPTDVPSVQGLLRRAEERLEQARAEAAP